MRWNRGHPLPVLSSCHPYHYQIFNKVKLNKEQ